jgi:hypothetical protein
LSKIQDHSTTDARLASAEAEQRYANFKSIAKIILLIFIAEKEQMKASVDKQVDAAKKHEERRKKRDEEKRAAKEAELRGGTETRGGDRRRR